MKQPLSTFTFTDFEVLPSDFPLTYANQRDVFGYTPLHLAAQNNNASATTHLLLLGANVDGKGSKCRSTPLHRASFSGAVECIGILVSEGCDLMARDESFGDNMTPLHKAVKGGRYLAVRLLIEALDRKSDDLLGRALKAIDSNGRTPLDLAKEIIPLEKEERRNAARWDVVAGCKPDWFFCKELLEAAEIDAGLRLRSGINQGGKTNESSDASLPLNSGSKTNSFQRTPKSTVPDIFLPFPRHIKNICICLDCGPDKKCNTSSWEIAFRNALCASVEAKLSHKMFVCKM